MCFKGVTGKSLHKKPSLWFRSREKKKETVQQRKVVHEENEIKGLEQGMTKERTDV